MKLALGQFVEAKIEPKCQQAEEKRRTFSINQ
jgi:hypothetical protein